MTWELLIDAYAMTNLPRNQHCLNNKLCLKQQTTNCQNRQNIGFAGLLFASYIGRAEGRVHLCHFVTVSRSRSWVAVQARDLRRENKGMANDCTNSEEFRLDSVCNQKCENRDVECLVEASSSLLSARRRRCAQIPERSSAPRI